MSYSNDGTMGGYSDGTMGAVVALDSRTPARGIDVSSFTPAAQALFSNPIPGTNGAPLTTQIAGSSGGVPYTANMLNVQGIDAAFVGAIRKQDAPDVPLISDWISWNNQLHAATGRYGPVSAGSVVNQVVIYGVQNPGAQAALAAINPQYAYQFQEKQGLQYIPGQGWLSSDTPASRVQDLGTPVEPTTYVGTAETRTTPPPLSPPASTVQRAQTKRTQTEPTPTKQVHPDGGAVPSPSTPPPEIRRTGSDNGLFTPSVNTSGGSPASAAAPLPSATPWGKIIAGAVGLWALGRVFGK